jgi:hypothetical protein
MRGDSEAHIWRPDDGMSRMAMKSRMESIETIASLEPGLLFMDISATNATIKVHKTDRNVLGRINASFGW